MAMAVHDDGHRIGSHKTDDMLIGRGKEDAHDEDLASFMMRSGFPERLMQAGLIDEHYSFIKLEDLSLHDLMHRSEHENDMTNWPSKSGYLEVERLQYLLHEFGIWVYDMPTAREILSHVERDRDSPLGDHLVFTDQDASVATKKGQIRCQTEHWLEPMNEAVDEFSNTMWRYGLICGDPALARYAAYYPGDTLYTLEEDWQKALMNLGHRHEAFISGFNKICEKLCDLQRRAHAEIDGHHTTYERPAVPDWLSIHERMPIRGDVRQGVSFKKIGDTALLLEIEQAKIRVSDPLVKLPGKGLQRVSQLRPDVEAFQERQGRWSGRAYSAEINLTHPRLGLTTAERKAMRKGLAEIKAKWPDALKRPKMSPEIFRQRIDQARTRYRKIGAVPSQALLKAA